MIKKRQPAQWDLKSGKKGELMINNFKVTSLAEKYGTPLHIINQPGLEKTAKSFRLSVEKVYPGKTSVHYAFKCNSVPAIVQIIKRCGLKAEVMTEYELDLALRIGFNNEDIIVNGPCKSDNFLIKCVETKVKLIVIDSLNELEALDHITDVLKKEVKILLRINPNYIPKGMNKGTATGSRRGSLFGLDLKSGEVQKALSQLKGFKRIHFFGFHFHIGTGIRNPNDYANVIKIISPLYEIAQKQGLLVKILDIGGGFASFTTRELTTGELLLYQGLNKFPSSLGNNKPVSFTQFAQTITKAVLKCFSSNNLPELIFEPGRCISSPNQLLVLKVHRIKDRPGIGKWIITDGGLGTVTMPTYYEYHEVLLCNDAERPLKEKVTISGPGCFAADLVYRNKLMPKIKPGEFIAIMDSGAYFTALESSFGFPRPAIISVDKNSPVLVRDRETFYDMILRDNIDYSLIRKED